MEAETVQVFEGNCPVCGSDDLTERSGINCLVYTCKCGHMFTCEQLWVITGE